MVTFEGLLFNSSMRNWDVHLVLLERSWWVGFNGIYFISFAIRMWEISKFKWFLSLQFQINYRKPGLERKISWKCGHTCRSYVMFQKFHIRSRVQDLIDPNLRKQFSYVEFPLFWNGFTLEPTTQATLHKPQHFMRHSWYLQKALDE